MEGRARRWIIAGSVAGLGLASTAVTSVVSEQIKDFAKYIIGEVVNLGEGYSCEARTRNRPSNPQQPVVLFPRLEDDPKDELWRTIIKILYDETEFNTIPSCERFASTRDIDISTARTQFLSRMAAQIAAAHADMLLFGTVYSPGKIKVWSANRLGGCDWQKSSPIDLKDPTAPDQVFAATRSALFRAIAEGLIAACDRDTNNDWSEVARAFDVVSSYVEKRKSLLTPKDYDEVLAHLFALSESHYRQIGDEQWFERALKSARSLIKERQASKNEELPAAALVQGSLGALYWAKFERTGSATALQTALMNFRLARQATPPWLWEETLSEYGDEAVAAFDAGLRMGIGDVRVDELDRIRAERTDLQFAKHNEAIRANPQDARAYFNRGTDYIRMEDYERATADYTQSLQIDPKNYATWERRGRSNFYRGRYQQAETDLAEAAQGAPENAYPALWLYFVRARTANDVGPGPLQANADKLKQAGWPFPIVEIILGSGTAEQVLASAKTIGERCEAEFYLGEWELKNGAADKANQRFKAALRVCPKDFVEYTGALTELKRLDR